MKKTYTKPEIMFEDFTLSTNIASGCEVKTRTPSENQCGVNASGINVFIEGMTGCEGFPVPDNGGGDGEFGNICYHVPYGENLFTS